MFGSFDEVHEAMEVALGTLEVGAANGQDAAVGVALFSIIENMAAAGKALCAARVADTRHWRVAGDRTAAHWVARTTGCSMAEALAATQVPERLRSLPATDFEFRSGGLSLTQARHITEAASADPSTETELIEMARREPLATLRAQCQRVVAAACDDDEARYRRLRDGRYLRHWTDAGGAFRMDLATTPDVGAEMLAALRPIAKRLGRQARRNGHKVRKEAALADALADLCRPKDESGQSLRPRVSINIRADRDAWLRGRTRPGETCEVDGGGHVPVPVSVAQALIEDGEVNFVGMEGGEVVSLVSHSRHIPADVRRAVIARDPICVVPGCYERENLQFHHWPADFVKSRRTSLGDLCRACEFHHDLVTRGHFVLLGGPGKWEFLPKTLLDRMRSGTDPPVLARSP